MIKPTRDQFQAIVLGKYPGATVVKGDRGLIVTVSTDEIASEIKRSADVRDLRTQPIERVRPEIYVVRIFGFPRKPGRKVGDTYWPADAEDQNLKTIFTQIIQEADKGFETEDPFVTLTRVRDLATKGLGLLEGKA